MTIEQIDIQNFRSFNEKTPVKLNGSYNILFGKNSSGKSNILRAINLFFNQETDPGKKYDSEIDTYCFNKLNTNISLTLRLEPNKDKWLLSYLDKNFKGLFTSNVLNVTMTLKPSGVIQYTFQVAQGRRQTIPLLIEYLRKYVNCVYIPSVKDPKDILYIKLMKKIVASTFQGWGKGIESSKRIGKEKERFKELLISIQDILEGSSSIVSDGLLRAWDRIEGFNFMLPINNLEDFLGKLNYSIKEKDINENIELENIGSGIQAYTIIVILYLLHQIRNKGVYVGNSTIWLIEEPETFMHYDLQRKTRESLLEFSKEACILITTHSPVFANKMFYKSTFLVDFNKKSSVRNVNSKYFVKTIFNTFGVKINDFLDIKRFNVLVEGDTDKQILDAAIKKMKEIDKEFEWDEDDIGFIPCGSANAMPHFYNLYSPFTEYSDFWFLLDRDDAGLKANADLLSNGIDEKSIILIANTNKNIDDPGIEDVIDHENWLKLIEFLDKQELINVISQNGKVVRYSYTFSNRVNVKKASAKYIVGIMNKTNVIPKNYITILKEIQRLWLAKR